MELFLVAGIDVRFFIDDRVWCFSLEFDLVPLLVVGGLVFSFFEVCNLVALFDVVFLLLDLAVIFWVEFFDLDLPRTCFGCLEEAEDFFV